MGLKVYSMRLEEFETEKVKEFLKKNGTTLGKVVNEMVLNLARAIEGQPHYGSKPVKDLTLSEFGDLMKYWMHVPGEDYEVEK